MEDFDAIRRGYPISITKPKNEHCTARTLTKAILSAFPPHSLQWTTHLSHLIGAYFGARQEEATDWFHWKHEAFLVIVQHLRWLTKQTWVSVTCLEGFMCFAPEKHAHPSPNSSVSGWLRLQRAPIKLATQLYKQTSKGDRSWGKESGFVTLQGEIESQSLPERLLPKENPLQFLPLARTNISQLWGQKEQQSGGKASPSGEQQCAVLSSCTQKPLPGDSNAAGTDWSGTAPCRSQTPSRKVTNSISGIEVQLRHTTTPSLHPTGWAGWPMCTPLPHPRADGFKADPFGAGSKTAFWDLTVCIMPGVKLDGYNGLFAALTSIEPKPHFPLRLHFSRNHAMKSGFNQISGLFLSN